MADKATFNSIAPQLVVPDVVAAAEYYRDTFGFHLLGYFADPPVYSMVARDGVEIHFGLSEQAGPSNAVVRSGSFDVYIWVSDVQAVFQELRERGADIIEGPVRRIYESTEVAVRDLNGYHLVFAD